MDGEDLENLKKTLSDTAKSVLKDLRRLQGKAKPSHDAIRPFTKAPCMSPLGQMPVNPSLKTLLIAI